jgi:SAM-dependent methyltransferase
VSEIRDQAAFEHGWRKRFEGFARTSDDDPGIAGWSASGLGARTRRFAGLWQPGSAGEVWLDAGCGAGTYARYLSEFGMQVVGADYSFTTLEKARGRVGAVVSFVMADVRHLPFLPGRFDGVLCFGVLQALAESGDAISELALQVAPGGTLWVDGLNRFCVVHAFDLVRRRLRGKPLHLRYESPARIAALLRANGLVDVGVHWMPILPARWSRFQRFLESRLVQRAFALVPALGSFVSHAFIATGRKPIPVPARSAS